ncbi:MAG: YkgJ family cysteine cluster protein [bacterium]
MFKQIKEKLKTFFYSKILKRKYTRKGSCKGCGRCCQRIYVRHASDVIKTEAEFEKLKTLHFFYGYLKVLDKDEVGLVFECSKLDKESGKCTAYNKRPVLCRQYPVEELFMMGGSITENCGYSFEPIQKFEEVLSKAKAKISKN